MLISMKSFCGNNRVKISQIDLAENNYPRAVEDGNIFVAHDANRGNAMR